MQLDKFSVIAFHVEDFSNHIVAYVAEVLGPNGNYTRIHSFDMLWELPPPFIYNFHGGALKSCYPVLESRVTCIAWWEQGLVVGLVGGNVVLLRKSGEHQMIHPLQTGFVDLKNLNPFGSSSSSLALPGCQESKEWNTQEIVAIRSTSK